MKKYILYVIIILAVSVIGAFIVLKNIENKPVSVENNIVKSNQEDKENINEERIDKKKVDKKDASATDSSRNNNIISEYDEEIEKLIKDNYFNGITNPDIISCAQDIKDEIESTELKMSFYGGRNVNGVNYDKKNNCIRFNKDCEEEVLISEDKQILEVIDNNRFNIVNGCLYDGQNKTLDYNLFAYTHTDFFTKKIDRIGEYADEWFRFKEGNNLYIYLSGAAGCGGCVFNGPYLLIDLGSGLIKGKQSDLPYLPYLVLSPNKKVAIEASWDENNKTKLYLFDFITNKRSKLIYEVPENKSILVQGHGVYLVERAITWEDNSVVKIQLFEKSNTDGYVKSEYIDNVGSQYFKSGEPVTINIEN